MCIGNPEIGGIGGVIRNNKSDWIVGFSKGYPSTTNKQIELLALLEGLKLIEHHNLIPVEINIDSIQIIHILKQGNLYYDPILDACRSMLIKLAHPTVAHYFCEQNNVADIMAKEEARKSVFENTNVFVVVPVFALEHV